MMLLTTSLDPNDWLKALAGPGAERMAEIGFASFLILMVVSVAAGLFVAGVPVGPRFGRVGGDDLGGHVGDRHAELHRLDGLL